ncbi:hypothetical protein AKJ66_03460, partial [candidate division MSBL1 archaeon SCGC-AAA259E22]
MIDFHNHFFPREYLELLEEKGEYAEVEKENGKIKIYYEGDYNVIEEAHYNLEKRLEYMDRVGIEKQVLSLTTPGVEREKT